jgi:hypothetical protein
MPDPHDIPRRRRVLVLDVAQAAAQMSRLVHEATTCTCPSSPASATAATPWSAGRSCSKTSSPKPPVAGGARSGGYRLRRPDAGEVFGLDTSGALCLGLQV